MPAARPRGARQLDQFGRVTLGLQGEGLPLRPRCSRPAGLQVETALLPMPCDRCEGLRGIVATVPAAVAVGCVVARFDRHGGARQLDQFGPPAASPSNLLKPKLAHVSKFGT